MSTNTKAASQKGGSAMKKHDGTRPIPLAAGLATPCPFCGQPAVMKSWLDAAPPTERFIGCGWRWKTPGYAECGVTPWARGDTEAEALDAWNTRAAVAGFIPVARLSGLFSVALESLDEELAAMACRTGDNYWRVQGQRAAVAELQRALLDRLAAGAAATAAKGGDDASQ